MRKIKNEELVRKSIQDFKTSEKIPLILILDNVRSLNNIGSIFRISDAFLIEKIILCGITACPPHKDIHKTALGATDSVSWEYYSSTIQAVKKLNSEGKSVWAVEQTENATLLENFRPIPKKSYCFVLGNEVKGVDQLVVDYCNKAIEIPQFGTKHSLNISVAAGIIVWDFYVKMRP